MMSIELFKTSTKRNSTFLYIIFQVITFKFYEYFWMFSRINYLNKISKSKISYALVKLFIISVIFSISLNVYSTILIYENIDDNVQGESFFVYGIISSIFSFIIKLLVAFSMKKVLKEFSDNNEIKISYNRFFTFLFDFLYINYKINENIDYIANNNIFDKRENLTSDKEITPE